MKFYNDHEILKYGTIFYSIFIGVLFKLSSMHVHEEAVLYFGSMYLVITYLIVAYYFLKLTKDHAILEVNINLSKFLFIFKGRNKINR